MAVDKLERQRVLRRLLATGQLASQREVQQALKDEGIACTQGTVSRDLDELGAVKVRGVDGALVYRLTAEIAANDARSRLDGTLRQFVTGVTHSGNLVVLRTPPACAQPVASVIDLAGLDDVVATVAGDDTVLVVAADGVPGSVIAQRFQQSLGLKTPLRKNQP